MAKMMTQLGLLSKHVVGGGLKVLHTIGTSSGQCPKDAKFKKLYNEEVNYKGNQLGGSHPNYQRWSVNQGWNKEWDNGWKDWREQKAKKMDTFLNMIVQSQENKLDWRETEPMKC